MVRSVGGALRAGALGWGVLGGAVWAAGASAVWHERLAWAEVSGGVAQRAWLGLEFESGRRAEATAARGPRVLHVFRSSPAFVAGVRDRDVVVAIDDRAVARPDEVVRAVSASAPGQRMRLSLLRGDRPVLVSVLLAPVPSSDQVLRLDTVGLPAPTWKPTLKPVSGDVPKNLGELRGKVVVLDFWASWCAACRMSAARLTQWQKQYGAQGLAIIGITGDPVEEAARSAMEFGMRYSIAADEASATHQAYGVHALPTIFVVDKHGIIREASVGYDPGHDDALEALLVKLLAEPGA